MVSPKWKLVTSSLAAATLCFAPLAASAQVIPPEKPEATPPSIPSADIPPGNVQEEGSETPTPLLPASYWIGLACSPVGEALQAQLNLEAGQGLVIENVVPDAPAEKAGLKANDVLVRAGDKKLSSVADLADAVASTAGKVLPLAVIRGGKEVLIEVQPVTRPQVGEAQEFPGFPGFRPGMGLADFFRQGPGGNFSIIGPGLVLDAPLPDDLKITIEKKADGPRKIIVEKGEDRYEVTEDQLGELAAGIRPFVERLLGPPAPVLPPDVRDEEGRARLFRPGFRLFRNPDRQELKEENLEDKVEELSREIEQLRKALKKQKDEAPEGNGAPTAPQTF